MNQPELKLTGQRKPGPFVYIALVTFLVLLLYAYFRIFEFDEGWSYWAVKSESFLDLIMYKHYNNANNHIINSLWFKTLQLCGVKDIIFYRSLNLLCFIVYSYYLYKLARHSVSNWQNKHDAYLILFYMPTVVFFFASGRGYGMALAFFVAALYFMKLHLTEKTQKTYFQFLFCGIVSSIAIVSFYFPFIAMVLYMYGKKIPFKLFTTQNIIGGVILLGLTGYIYYVGNTIIVNDVVMPGTDIGIINGTDNLFINGMYASFVDSLSIYFGVFPDKDLYIRYHIQFVSKVWIIVTAVPALWILIKTNITKYTEYIILAIVTVLFLMTHIILKSKYPSDRSSSYLLFLIYLPIIYCLVTTKSIWVKIHYFSVLFFGLINLFSFFHELTMKPTIYSVMKKMPEKNYTIISDWPNYADMVHNEFYFHGRLNFQYLFENYERDSTLILNKIKMAATNRDADFVMLQDLNYTNNQQLFSPDSFTVQHVISSNSKDFYLLQRKK